VLHFAPGEEHFPTTPFLTAYYRLENNAVPSAWGDDGTPQFTPGTGSSLLLNRLDSLYMLAAEPDQDGVLTQARPAPTVFYRVRDLTPAETRRIWRGLKDDPYSWRRFWNVSSLARDIDHEPLMVIEYYFYYIRDRGLVGHIEDIEMVFVFIPQDPDRICDFRIIVGAGHTDQTPNNILLMNELLAPRHSNVHVLVELGGHSSAPDLPPYGRYQLGTDINWNLYHAWGTRDIQAISGSGWSGPYRPEMTVSRDTVSAVILIPDTHFVFRPGVRGANQFQYRLIPVESLQQLSEAVEAFDRSGCAGQAANRGECETAVARMYTAYELYAISLGISIGETPRTEYGDLDQQLVAWVRKIEWLDPGQGFKRIVKRPQHAIWRHPLYTEAPTIIFKDHLVAPSMIGTRYFSPRWLTWGAAVWPHEAAQFNIGVMVPKVISEITLPGFSQFQVGLVSPDWLDGLDRRGVSLAVLVDTSYEERIGYYGKLAHLWNAREVTDSITGSSWTLSGGASIIAQLPRNSTLFGLVNVLRIRVGGRINLNPPSRFSRIDAEFQVEFRQ
jgi:hypothetical protein